MDVLVRIRHLYETQIHMYSTHQGSIYNLLPSIVLFNFWTSFEACIMITFIIGICTCPGVTGFCPPPSNPHSLLIYKNIVSVFSFFSHFSFSLPSPPLPSLDPTRIWTFSFYFTIAVLYFDLSLPFQFLTTKEQCDICTNVSDLNWYKINGKGRKLFS